MTRVATVDNEDYLLMIAQHGTAYHMETLVRKYRRVKRLQEDDAGKQHDERSFHVYHEPDGTMVLHARLPAEKGALILKEDDNGKILNIGRKSRIIPPAMRRGRDRVP